MFKNRLFTVLRAIRRIPSNVSSSQIRKYTPTTLRLLGATVFCAENHDEFSTSLYDGNLEHEFLIRQATTVNVNAATQLLTVTLVAIQDTSERLRDALSKEICLVQQAMEWGEVTPPEHWDQLVAVRGTLCDLRHNLRTLYSYLDYAEKIATVAAEISYLSGNNAASDAICERIEQALRSCNIQKELNQVLQEESLELQQKAIISSPQLEDKLVKDATDKKQQTTDDAIDKVKLTIDDAIDKVKLTTDNAVDKEKLTTDDAKDNNSDVKL